MIYDGRWHITYVTSPSPLKDLEDSILYSDTLISRLCPSTHTETGGDRGVELNLCSSCKRVGQQSMQVKVNSQMFSATLVYWRWQAYNELTSWLHIRLGVKWILWPGVQPASVPTHERRNFKSYVWLTTLRRWTLASEHHITATTEKNDVYYQYEIIMGAQNISQMTVPFGANKLSKDYSPVMYNPFQYTSVSAYVHNNTDIQR
jgi:hypothetical protein